ncbi:MAG TPA: hypothetical protein VN631_03975 [Negativicutes bacterium]|nr:hypothetical protein [Negativicutes bacterium]
MSAISGQCDGLAAVLAELSPRTVATVHLLCENYRCSADEK